MRFKSDLQRLRKSSPSRIPFKGIWVGLLFAFGSLNASPVVTSVDYDAVPIGKTITLTGSGLEGVTGASLLWSGFEEVAVVNPVNDTTLEVVMPNLRQPSREYMMLVEGNNGSTVLIPPVFREVTSAGANDVPAFNVPTVIRAGGRLEQGVPFSVTVVETGGFLSNHGQGTIVAEDGAVVDFTGVNAVLNARFFYSPETTVIGGIPEGMTARELTAIETSHGTATFTAGFEIEITVVGDGSVTVSPDQLYYRGGTEVILTAVPGEGQVFSEWSGSLTSTENPLTSAGVGAVTATFLGGRLLEFYDVAGVTVALAPEGGIHPPGAVVSLEAVVEPGYEFLGWAGDASGTEESTTVLMDGDLLILPMVRAIPDEAAPRITSVDYDAVPVGGTISLSGSGLTNPTAARMIWQSLHLEAQVNGVDDGTAEVVMPQLQQGGREHILLVEGEKGSTVVFPPNPSEVTAAGTSEPTGPSATVLVRGGGDFNEARFFPTVAVKTGGIFRNVRRSIIFAENGAVIDLTGVTLGSGIFLYRSPETVIVGSIPPGMAVFDLSPIEVSEDVASFTLGYEMNITIVGDGEVTVSPDQQYFRSGDQVTLTAVPGEGQLFSGWSGAVTSAQNPFVGSLPSEITATFSNGWSLDFYDIPGVTVQVTPDAAVHAPGSVVSLEAILEPGYELLQWAGDASGSETTTTVEMNGNRLVLPVVRAVSVDSAPQISSTDYLALPPGETMTLSGTGFGGITAARMLWGSFDISASVNSVDETTLEVVMPELFQGGRKHLLLLEGATGSTVALPADFVEVTAAGVGEQFGPGAPMVVRAGGQLNEEARFLSTVVVETGGIVRGSSRGIIIAENGAVVDFRETGPGFNSFLYHSPDTVIWGEIPEGVTVRELSPIEASFDVGSFTIGFPLSLTIEGPGSVTVTPEQEFYGIGESVNLVATPDEGAFFIRWLGVGAARESTVTTGVGPGEIVARFSTAPDFFSTWRPQHFTDEELGDLSVSSFDADPDKDSLSNAAEYALGSDPRKADGGGALKLVTKPVDGVLRIFVEYYRPKNALDVEYIMLLSSDNENWVSNNDDPELVLSVERGAVEFDEDTELVTVELYPNQEIPASLFVRISATLF